MKYNVKESAKKPTSGLLVQVVNVYVNVYVTQPDNYAITLSKWCQVMV